MEYKINVSLDGRHYFEAHPIGASEAEARALYIQLTQLFPVSDGYRHTLTQWSTRGIQLAYSKPL